MSYAKIYEMTSIDGKAEDLVLMLHELSILVRGCDGCEDFLIFRDSAVTNSFTAIERWSSKAAHVRSSEVVPPEAFKSLMTLLSGKPGAREFEVLSASA